MRLADHDLGTPKGGGERVSLVINGQRVEADRATPFCAPRFKRIFPFQTLLHRLLEAFGSCRMCLVEVDGRKNRCPLAPSPLARVWW